MKGENNHMFGRNDQCYGPHGIATINKKNKNKTLEDIHGKEKAFNIKKTWSQNRKGIKKSREHARNIGLSRKDGKYMFDIYTGKALFAKDENQEFDLLSKGYLYGSNRTLESREGPNLNKILINNGSDYKYIYYEEVEKYTDAGWNIGFTEKYRSASSKNRKNRCWVNNGKIERWVKLFQKEALLSLGWQSGRLGWEKIQKASFGRSGGKYFNNGKNNKRVFSPHEEEELLKNGWKPGKCYSELRSVAQKNKMTGRIVIENGVKEKRVSLDNFNNYYKYKGYRKGRLVKSNYKNNIIINKGE